MVHVDKYGQIIDERLRVCYVPVHAHDNLNHADVEWGYIASWNDNLVFVKFDRSLSKFGWEGTTSQSCQATDLIINFDEIRYPKDKIGDKS